MQGPYLRKYGVAAVFNFQLFEVDGVDFRKDASFATGDMKIMKDEGAEANTFSGWTDEGQGYSFDLTGTEMQAKRIVIYIVDQSVPKVWLDTVLVIETYGSTSGQHAFDLDQFWPDVNVKQISGDTVAADNLEKDYDGTGYAKPASTIGTATAVTNDVSITQAGADKVWSTTTRTITGLTTAAIKAIWDQLTSALTLAGSIGKLIVDNLDAVISTLKTKIDELHDNRLTATRAGYLDKLNITGNVASSGEVTAIQNNTRVRVIIPSTLERPDSGSTAYQLDLYIYDTDGNMEAPDSLPTITAKNEAGTDRSANLGTVTLVETGVYRVSYTVSSSHAIEQIRFEWSIVEGGVTKKHGASTQIVDTTAVDFTASDRSDLQGIKAKTDSLAFTTANKVDSRVDNVGATAVTGPSDLKADVSNLDAAVSSRATPAQVKTQADQALVDVNLDHLLATDTPAPLPGAAGSILKDLLEDDGGVWRLNANALEQAPGGGSGETRSREGTAQGGSASTITLDAGASATDDLYKHAICAITGGTGAGESQVIDSYVGASKVATMAASWAIAPDATSQFVILPLGTLPGATAPSAAQVADAVYDEARTGHDSAGSFGELFNTVHARAKNKRVADKSNGETKFYDDDGTTLRFTTRVQKGATDNEVEQVPV